MAVLTARPGAPTLQEAPFESPHAAITRLRHAFAPPYLLAFSGGPDSLALFTLLHHSLRGASNEGAILLAHVDHGLDPGSATRARSCRDFARHHGVGFYTTQLVPPARFPGGVEAWARGERYRLLERWRRACGARWILTAHHADDQIETLLLRMLAGTRVWGLQGIQEHRGQLLRPLLRVRQDALRATALRATTPMRSDLPLHDPTNEDLRRTRNLIRMRLRPWLERRHAQTAAHLVGVAAGAARLRRRHLDRIARAFDLRQEQSAHSIALAACLAEPRSNALQLDPPRLELALEVLHRAAAAPPHRRTALQELQRQLLRHRSARLDIGDHWTWRTRPGHSDLRLVLQRRPRRAAAAGGRSTPEDDEETTQREKPRGCR